MYRPPLGIDEGRSGAPVHHKRIDSTHTPYISPDDLHSTKQDFALRVRQDRGTGSMVHRHPAPGSDRPHPSTQVPPIQGWMPQQKHGRTSRPRQDTFGSRVTYDRYHHNSTLRVVNARPTVPCRTVREVYALHGEPDVKPRKIDRPSEPQKLQVVNLPDEPRTVLAIAQGHEPRHVLEHNFKPFEPLDYQQRLEDFEEMYDHGARLKTSPTGSTCYFEPVKPHSSREHSVAEGFGILRCGSGKRAKFRRGVMGLFGIKHD